MRQRGQECWGQSLIAIKRLISVNDLSCRAMRPEQVQLQLVRSSLCLPPSISPMARARELVYNELTTGGNSIPQLHLSIRFNHNEKFRNSPVLARVVYFPGFAGRRNLAVKLGCSSSPTILNTLRPYPVTPPSPDWSMHK